MVTIILGLHFAVDFDHLLDEFGSDTRFFQHDVVVTGSAPK